MIPENIYYFLGYNNLAFMLSQERKHWLMKADKRKQVYDPENGQLFEGKIENGGANIIVESEKLSTINPALSKFKYASKSAGETFGITPAPFPYSAGTSGLMSAIIKSINFPTNYPTDEYSTYKLKLSDCKVCLLPFAGDTTNNGVWAGQWLVTNTPPKVILSYGDEKSLQFAESGATYYYPLNENLQTVPISNTTSNTYVTDDFIDSNDDIGLPMYFFKGDPIGPILNIQNNYSTNGSQIFFICNEGTADKYHAKIYICVDGDNNATPDGSATSAYKIRCYGKGDGFTGTPLTDRDVPIGKLYFIKDGDKTKINLGLSTGDSLTFSDIQDWTYVDGYYEITMSDFDGNCFKYHQDPLVSIFDVAFDATVGYEDNTDDTGYAGIYAMSSNDVSDLASRYPHGLDIWDGIPDWIATNEGVSQHLAIYAIHNVPDSDPMIQDSYQMSAILLDPGKPKEDETEELSNDERGRAYLLSNDPAEYDNNAKSENPKPPRTIARICDIPTSIAQLIDISGIGPTTVVDKKYVRSEASYKAEDQERLYNEIGNRWVKPTDMDANGYPIYGHGETNKFVFSSPESLNQVDLINHNSYRYIVNLNAVVSYNDISLSTISEPGSGYTVENIGKIIVGGKSFEYTVTEVDGNGGVTGLTLAPSDLNDGGINLSDFDLAGHTGLTQEYGTSPVTGAGTGLKIVFKIDNYESYLPEYGAIYDDIFALVKDAEGLCVYGYYIDADPSDIHYKEKLIIGEWTKQTKIAEYESKSTSNYANTTDAIIAESIPFAKELPIRLHEPIDGETTISVCSNASFVSIIDNGYSPLVNEESETFDSYVSISGISCPGLIGGNENDPNSPKAPIKDVSGVIQWLKDNGAARYDSYVFWRWINPDDMFDTRFEYGIIHRSFNNLVTTDTVSYLPNNDLPIKNFIHANPSTTIAWDVEGFGPMLWTYNPNSRSCEDYIINSNTQELEIYRTPMPLNGGSHLIPINGTSNFIDLCMDRNNTVTEGVLQFNILSNNAINTGYRRGADDPIYMQPDYQPIAEVGDDIGTIDNDCKMVGNWQLVYPRIHTFKFRNDVTNSEYTPVQMSLIRMNNVSASSTVLDEYNNNINSKVLILSANSTDSPALNIYNPNKDKWEKL